MSKLLQRCAVFGGVFAVGGGAFFYHRIQENFASTDFYKMSIAEFKKHGAAVDAIGEPVRVTYMNLGRNDIQVDKERAQIVIPVRGSKSKGNLYSYSIRDDALKSWILKELSLEVKSTKQIISIKKNE